ncbi:hypothetical protein N7530_004346 [Penicillium desertorum]|uniref:Uncharacterized protein n=1 Tax=Penicillium desertorum TaxID=1303715 RepID=A0A9X0BQP2_9EURO|nr:hypothetical protein N7530_004346 [Penicillium desertorum]
MKVTFYSDILFCLRHRPLLGQQTDNHLESITTLFSLFANPHHRPNTLDSRHHQRDRRSPRTHRIGTQRTQKANGKFQCSEIPLRVLMS